MNNQTSTTTYIPGTYAKRIPDGPAMVEKNLHRWQSGQQSRKLTKKKDKPAPAICFSRKIGVGAVEIADVLSSQIGYQVVDREILEHIARSTKLREKTVSMFDERHPGSVSEFLTMLFGEKSFIQTDYTRHLFSSIFTISNLEPTIFVGRGTHLILERSMVLAVRLISSDAYRTKRLRDLLNTSIPEAEAILKAKDAEQKRFFKKVFNKSEASPYEFDIVINCDLIRRPTQVAAIVVSAFREKFPHQIAT